MRRSGGTPRDGDQFRLDLFRGLPWDGQDPRALTRASSALFLRPEPHRHEVFFDPEQQEFWPVDQPPREKGPTRSSRGASLLLEPF